ncbi:hypothetical protein JCM3770_002077 [Rhodotorula araucariae]
MDSTEFLDIGRHCSEESCRQLDFLPFSCPSCQLPFCQEHWRPPSGHKCSSYDPLVADNRIPSCPLCSTPVSYPPGTDPNGPMDAHLSTACPVLHPHLASSTARTKSPNECHAMRCRVKMVVPIQCDACGHKFCPAHRHANDHACRARTAAGPGASRQLHAQGNPGRVKKTFGGLLSGAGKNTAASSSAPTPSARTKPAGPSLAGLAALRRAQQHAREPAMPVGTSANPLVLDSSSSEDSDVQVLSARKPPTSGRPSAGAGAGVGAVKNPSPALAATGLRGAGSKRAAQEQESARRALEVRAKKGLLTEDEKVNYATMQAMQAKQGRKTGGEDACVLS